MEAQEQVWPSIDDHHPLEEGGPNARAGLSYQDAVAVGILLEMLADPTIQKVHCETHDDIVVKRSVGGLELAEYIQVKSNEPDSLWSVATLCSGGIDSLCGKSLARDCCKEVSRFRIITLRAVVSDLAPLTYACYGPGRESSSPHFLNLAEAVKAKLPDLQSKKGNGIDYWLEHCLWKVVHDEDAIRLSNVVEIMKLAAADGYPLFPEQTETIEGDLRDWVFDAGRAFWIPDKAKKIITRAELMTWWKERLTSITDGASQTSGQKLRQKMTDALLSDDQIRMAIELRRDYGRLIRTSVYMSERDIQVLQGRVKSALTSLRARQMAGQITSDGQSFHALCIQEMDAINGTLAPTSEDQAAFLKGCMYDIADRCLHRFTRPQR